ncbi:amidohydrolase [Intrasporangium oryzae NRRL B-24470]|uniref:Amidohydrolase n=1 Tax=Intrasporangium oryzae NRRL B-24470 TaxID=1386089 RepID=W9GDD9_9MICO|nr:amidohydrolase [Intrasporangium oryzae]EWT02848.1 amidohydrolase [Intrasporangium oryzae NRRL B-24470]
MSRVLLVHGRIRTGVDDAPWTDALLVEDGVVVAVGDEARASGLPAVELPGELVMPGLHDAHIHTEWQARDLSSVDLREAASLDEALALIRAHVAGLPDGEWLHSGRWNSNRWAVPIQPDRYALDAACRDRVAALSSVDGHTIWANSLALRLAGITRETPDPVGGEIVRDPTGQPTGILRESAQELLKAIPDKPVSPLRPWLEGLQEWLLSVGLTSITDIDGEEAREAYAAMHADGALRLRVTKCVRDDDLELAIAEGRRAGQGDERFRVGPVKFFSDGALGSHTAHMTEPFVGHEGCGIAVTPYPVLLQRIRMSLEAGLDVCTHAIGDEANRLVLDAFATMRGEGHKGILRIEHAQHVRLDDVPRFRELDVIASMQPSHCTADLELADAIIGDRPLASYAWRTLLDAGARLAFGSDAPVEDPNPFFGLHAAVTRQRADGFPPGGWRPDERISLDEAVHAHTVGAHEAVGRTDVGRLAVGQLADLVCLDRDLWSVEPDAIRDTQVLQTWVGGELAFER